MKPLAAISAASSPARAALPHTKLLAIVACISRTPDAWATARPMACTIRCVSNSRSFPAATAAPIPPAIPVMNRPRLLRAGGANSMFPIRHETSMPSANAWASSLPETACLAESARAAEITGPPGWMIDLRCVSSNVCTAELMQLRRAAFTGSSRSARPTRGAIGRPENSMRLARAVSTAS